ncbi:MATE family efflux transporter [Ornithinibacillus bavariensis]|uniref:Multidrug export protein MepA n=1 Tax=Ornithinibacillus bavariensis TaxID=545502 RepID=A0A919XAG4_9BACI|nr:MATE family efflux transporter [Ornithinibacillus bavariensis]GIO27095.1 MATE family efflux transporter [Ornithinibacillus bavariensis]
MGNHMNERFANEKIPKLIFSLATPAIVAQLINALYNVVDRMFIGRIPETGTLALTGIGIVFPIMMIIQSFSALIGFGAAPLASIKMGEGKNKKAEELLGSCLFMLLIASAVLTITFLIFKSPLLVLFGASPDTLPFAEDYMGIYLIGSVPVLISLGLNQFIAAQGFAKTAMITICIGAAVNIILDPIFIFGMNMGVKGAALATVISQTISAVWVIWFLTSKRAHLRLRFEHIRINFKIAGGVLALGLSPFIMQSTESLIQIVFNTSIGNYGGDLYVAAMGIMSVLMQLFTLLLNSFAQGAQPIIGYNYGAGDHERVKSTIKYSSVFCGIFGLIIWSVFTFLPQLPIMIFTNDPELITLTMELMKIFFLGTIIYGIQLAFQQVFIALGQAKVSIFIAVLRKIILLIPLVYILPMVISSKTSAVIIAEPIADFCSVLTCCILFGFKIKHLLKGSVKKTIISSKMSVK